MKAGRLRHSVTIQQDSGTTRSAIGEIVANWTAFATVWASVEPLRGTEAITLRMEGSEITTRIRTRYVDGVKPAMRVLHGTDLYNIVEVFSPQERKAELEMLCRRDAD